MEFIRKNFVTVLVVGATIALAGVAVFTALRLYQLRSEPITPAVPASTPGASDAPVGIRPKSGNWNHPESFIITNSQETDVALSWEVDCWDENLCEDSNGTTTLAPGESFEEGLGLICSQWQLNLNWSGGEVTTGAVDWAGVAELGPDCDVSLEDLTVNASPTPTGTAAPLAELTTEEASAPAQIAATGDYQIQACTTFSFSLAEAGTGTGGAVLTPSPTAAPVASAAPRVTQTPTTAPTTTSTPAPELPEAGIAAPTVIGVGFGFLLLIGALLLAL